MAAARFGLVVYPCLVPTSRRVGFAPIRSKVDDPTPVSAHFVVETNKLDIGC
jgi:hypothetical protein